MKRTIHFYHRGSSRIEGRFEPVTFKSSVDEKIGTFEFHIQQIKSQWKKPIWQGEPVTDPILVEKAHRANKLRISEFEDSIKQLKEAKVLMREISDRQNRLKKILTDPRLGFPKQSKPPGRKKHPRTIAIRDFAKSHSELMTSKGKPKDIKEFAWKFARSGDGSKFVKSKDSINPPKTLQIRIRRALQAKKKS